MELIGHARRDSGGIWVRFHHDGLVAEQYVPDRLLRDTSDDLPTVVLRLVRQRTSEILKRFQQGAWR